MLNNIMRNFNLCFLSFLYKYIVHVVFLYKNTNKPPKKQDGNDVIVLKILGPYTVLQNLDKHVLWHTLEFILGGITCVLPADSIGVMILNFNRTILSSQYADLFPDWTPQYEILLHRSTTEYYMMR